MPEIEAQGFRNEIKLLQKLKGNPRIVTLYDSEEREEENGSKRILYMVMEHGEKDLSRSGHLLNCFCFPFEKRILICLVGQLMTPYMDGHCSLLFLPPLPF